MKTRKRRNRNATKTLAIAVVLTPGETSGRPEGDWASFVEEEKPAVIKAAIEAKNKWETKGYGPYSIFVGTLTEEVTLPTNYKVTKLKGGAL